VRRQKVLREEKVFVTKRKRIGLESSKQ
jgi:hypothetical protein